MPIRTRIPGTRSRHGGDQRVPPAEFGDKNSLVVRITTKSGLDHPKPTGNLTIGYGSFKAPTGEVNFGMGNGRVGNFVTFSGMRTDRFLDPPEFKAIHDSGNSQSFFDRLDAHPTINDAFHLNLQFGRSSFSVPNTYDADALGQDQHQRITTANVAPGYSRVVNANLLLTVNGFVRHDHLVYTPSADPFADQPGTAGQDRTLTNMGVKTDLAYSRGPHNVKFGGTVAATRLVEDFSLGLTDATLNSPCLADGAPSDDTTPFCRHCAPAKRPRTRISSWPASVDPAQAAVFQFNGARSSSRRSTCRTKSRPAAHLNLGLRADHYDGLSQKSLVQPRAGASYIVPVTGTIVRASYGRTMETPYNENLVLASSASGAVFGTDGVPLAPGVRDHVDVGFQQSVGKWVQADFSYFYKHTTNGYDFGNLFNTPIFFPIAWDYSRIDGLAARISLVEHNGLSAFVVMGHSTAAFCPPATGGFLLEEAPDCFAIDHDQKFQQTTNVRTPRRPWAAGPRLVAVDSVWWRARCPTMPRRSR